MEPRYKINDNPKAVQHLSSIEKSKIETSCPNPYKYG